MSVYESLINQKAALSLVGLGYVGMPIAVAFSRKVKVIGYDLNEKKIELYKNGIDPTNEVGGDAVVLAVAHKEFTCFPVADLDKLYGEGKKVLVDVKGILSREAFEAAGHDYWRL